MSRRPTFPNQPSEIGPVQEDELLKWIRLGREESCSKKDRERAEEARQKLLASLFPMVLSIAKAHSGKEIPLADLVTVGSYGLVKSLEGFDFRESVRFSSFAYQGIQNEITAFLRREASAANKATSRNSVFWRVYLAKKHLKERNGTDPTVAEISELLGDIEPAQVSIALARSYGVESLDDSLAEDGESLESRLPSASVSPTDAAVSEERRELLLLAMNNLGPRERQVLTLLYGLDDGNQKTLKQVGEELGISGERVRQIKESALFRLRRIMGGKADETIVR